MVDHAEAVGKNAKDPSNAPDQPEQYFKGFQFQLPGFVGSDSTTMKEVKTFFDMVCEGSMLNFAQGIESYWNTKLTEIKCLCGRLKNAQIAVFEEGMNSKVGIKMDTVKKGKSKNEKHIIEKMPHWNERMRYKQNWCELCYFYFLSILLFEFFHG